MEASFSQAKCFSLSVQALILKSCYVSFIEAGGKRMELQRPAAKYSPHILTFWGNL